MPVRIAGLAAHSNQTLHFHSIQTGEAPRQISGLRVVQGGLLSFVTQDELDNLDEDPRMAFLALVNHAQRSLSQQTAKYDDPDNEAHWNRRQELEQRFMNVIVAAGKRFEVAPFTSMTIPKHANYSTSDYRQFESDLDHFVTQLVIDNSFRSKKMSVEILPDTKDKLRK